MDGQIWEFVVRAFAAALRLEALQAIENVEKMGVKRVIVSPAFQEMLEKVKHLVQQVESCGEKYSIIDAGLALPITIRPAVEDKTTILWPVLVELDENMCYRLKKVETLTELIEWLKRLEQALSNRVIRKQHELDHELEKIVKELAP